MLRPLERVVGGERRHLRAEVGHHPCELAAPSPAGRRPPRPSGSAGASARRGAPARRPAAAASSSPPSARRSSPCGSGCRARRGGPVRRAAGGETWRGSARRGRIHGEGRMSANGSSYSSRRWNPIGSAWKLGQRTGRPSRSSSGTVTNRKSPASRPSRISSACEHRPAVAVALLLGDVEGVVEEHDAAAAQPPHHPRHQQLRRVVAPVLGDHVPADHPVAGARGVEARGEALLAERRPEEAGAAGVMRGAAPRRTRRSGRAGRGRRCGGTRGGPRSGWRGRGRRRRSRATTSGWRRTLLPTRKKVPRAPCRASSREHPRRVVRMRAVVEGERDRRLAGWRPGPGSPPAGWRRRSAA